MDVTCDKCRTEYEFDESLISEAGTTVKCTACGHLFRIYRPGTPESQRRPAWMLKQPDGSVYTFERMTTLQRWIAEGKVSKDDMASRTGEGWQTLGTMKELTPFFQSAQAQSGLGLEDTWDIDEEGPTIRIPSPVGAIGRERGDPTPGPGPISPPKAPPPIRHGTPALGVPKSDLAVGRGEATSLPAQSGPPPSMPTSLDSPKAQSIASAKATMMGLGVQELPQNGAPASEQTSEASVPAAAEEWTEGDLLNDQSPAWTSSTSSQPSMSSVEQDPAWTGNRISQLSLELEPDEPPSGRGRLLKVAVPLIVVGVIGIAIGGLYLFWPEMFRDLAGQVVTFGGDQDGASDRAYALGREQFLIDTTEGFTQADREYHRAKADSGLAQAGLAEIYTTWSQYCLDDVSDNRLRAQKAEPTKAQAFELMANYQHDEFQEKLEQARRFVDAALKRSPETAEAHRAAADYYRLAGDLERARTHIDLALERGQGPRGALPETEYVKALIDLSIDGDVPRAISRLEKAVGQNDKLIRCHFRLGRLLAAAGEKNRATASLEKIVNHNKQHKRAIELLKALSSDEPLLVSVTSTTIGDQLAAGSADAGLDAEAETATDGATAIATAPTDAASPGTGDGLIGAPSNESFDSLLRRATKMQSVGSSGSCSLFRQADKTRPGHPEVLVGLGYCASDSGNHSQAVSYFRRALGSNGSYGPALIALASAYRRQGNDRQALEQYRRYLQRNPGGPQAGIARRNVETLEERLGEGQGSSEEPTQPSSDGSPSGGDQPPPGQTQPTPPATGDSPTGTPENPSVTRITNDQSPPIKRTDSLATDSEPPLRPDENLD